MIRYPWIYLMILSVVLFIGFWIGTLERPLIEAQRVLEQYSEEWWEYEDELIEYFVYQSLNFVAGFITLVAFLIHTIVRLTRRRRNVLS